MQEKHTTFMAFPANAAVPPKRKAPAGLTPEQQAAAVEAKAREIKGLSPQATEFIKETAQPVAQTPVVEQAQPAPYIPSAAVASSEGVSVALPSGFQFYPFKDLYVHPLRASHLAKIARSQQERRYSILVETISTLLATSEPSLQGYSLAHQLTLSDLEFVKLFVLQNSYINASIKHRTMCSAPEHLQRVENGEAPEQSLIIEHNIPVGSIQINKLGQVPDASELEQKVGHHLKPALMADVLEIMEHPATEARDAEFRFLSSLACYLDVDASIDEKIKLLDELNVGPQQLRAIRDYEALISNYGINRVINVTCTECGVSKESRFSLDAHDFLSN